MKKVLSSQWVPQELLEGVKLDFELDMPDEKTNLYSPEQLREKIASYDGLFALGATVDKALLDSGRNLRVVANFGVGYDNIDSRYAAQKRIYVTNTPHAVTDPTAELVIGLMIAAARNFTGMNKLLRTNRRTSLPAFLDPIAGMPSTLHRKRLGIIGMGRIGKMVAQKAAAFQMDIVYSDVVRAERLEAQLGARFLPFEEVLRTADYISVNCPYTPENHHMFNERTFGLMKNSAYFINAARGKLMDEAALIRALKSGQIRGAALDVYENEPLLSDELYELDNVVLVPHIGTFVAEARREMVWEAMDGLNLCLRGEVPENVVNLTDFPD